MVVVMCKISSNPCQMTNTVWTTSVMSYGKTVVIILIDLFSITNKTGPQENIDNIVNLSSRTFSSQELGILQLGLSFFPTPLYDPFKTRVDLYKLFWNIKFKNLRITTLQWRRTLCPMNFGCSLTITVDLIIFGESYTMTLYTVWSVYW